MNKRSLWKQFSDTKWGFLQLLCKSLNLQEVPGPLFVPAESGINDKLNGIEEPVTFTAKHSGHKYEVVHSLAKHKRILLQQGEFPVGEGLVVDMHAIRKDEQTSHIHSLLVHQFDWEKKISREQRTTEFLHQTVQNIWQCIRQVALMHEHLLESDLPEKIHFITTQELEDLYPEKSPKEREDLICKEHKAVLLTQIGDILKSGQKHDGRSPEYDDWSLNGDILVWSPVLGHSLELSSMGIRVDANSLRSQLSKAGIQEQDTKYHQGILQDTLPLSIGGGIGVERLGMFVLQLSNISELQ